MAGKSVASSPPPLLLLLLALLTTSAALGGVAQAAVSVASDITSNTVWTSANSPYYVTTNITIGSSATLSIASGVRVAFSPYTKITVLGTLITSGTAAAPISFNPVVDSTRFIGLVFAIGCVPTYYPDGNTYSSGSILSYVAIDSAIIGLDCQGDIPYISNVNITNSLSIALAARNTVPSPATNVPSNRIRANNLYINNVSGTGIDLRTFNLNLPTFVFRNLTISNAGAAVFLADLNWATQFTLNTARITSCAYGVYIDHVNSMQITLDTVTMSQITVRGLQLAISSSSSGYDFSITNSNFVNIPVALDFGQVVQAPFTLRLDKVAISTVQYGVSLLDVCNGASITVLNTNFTSVSNDAFSMNASNLYAGGYSTYEPICLFDNVVTSGVSGFGLKLTNCATTLRNSFITTSATGPLAASSAAAVYIYTGRYANVTNTQFISNGNALVLASVLNPNFISITNNAFTKGSQLALFVNSSLNSVTVSGNTFSFNSLSGDLITIVNHPTSAHSPYVFQNNTIASNIVRRILNWSGSSASSTESVLDNSFVNNTASLHTILCSSSCVNMRLSNNTFLSLPTLSVSTAADFRYNYWGTIQPDLIAQAFTQKGSVQFAPYLLLPYNTSSVLPTLGSVLLPGNYDPTALSPGDVVFSVQLTQPIYYVPATITVDFGTRLTVPDNTTIIFGPSTGINVNGEILANGTSAAGIVFQSEWALFAGSSNMWSGLVFSSTSSGASFTRYAASPLSILQSYSSFLPTPLGDAVSDLDFVYSKGSQLTYVSFLGGVNFVSAVGVAPYIANCVFANSLGDAVSLLDAGLVDWVVERSAFTGFGGNAVFLGGSNIPSNLVVRHTSFSIVGSAALTPCGVNASVSAATSSGNILVHNSTFSGGGTGVSIGLVPETVTIFVSQSTFTNQGNWAVFTDIPKIGDRTLRVCSFSNLRITGSGVGGIRVRNCHAIVDKNLFTSLTGAPLTAAVYTASDVQSQVDPKPVYELIVRNSNFTDCRLAVFTTGVYRVEITTNNFTPLTATFPSIKCTGSGTGNKIRENFFVSSPSLAASSSVAVVRIENGDTVDISQNTFVNYKVLGLISTSSSQATITENYFFGGKYAAGAVILSAICPVTNNYFADVVSSTSTPNPAIYINTVASIAAANFQNNYWGSSSVRPDAIVAFSSNTYIKFSGTVPTASQSIVSPVLVNPSVQLFSVSPSSQVADGIQSVTILGANFIWAVSYFCDFTGGTTATSFIAAVYINSTAIRCTMPTVGYGMQRVYIRGEANTRAAINNWLYLEFIATPQVESITPSLVDVNNVASTPDITIIGKRFYQGASILCKASGADNNNVSRVLVVSAARYSDLVVSCPFPRALYNTTGQYQLSVGLYGDVPSRANVYSGSSATLSVFSQATRVKIQLDSITYAIDNTVNTPLPRHPVAHILDANGNIVDSSAVVSIAAVPSTNISIFGNSAVAIHGIATFSSFGFVGVHGTNYTFVFSSLSLASDSVGPISINDCSSSQETDPSNPSKCICKLGFTDFLTPGSCTACPVGTYRNASLADCKSCPEKMTTALNSAVNASSCVCQLGTYLVSGNCVDCPRGAICFGGSTMPYAEAGYYSSARAAYTYFSCPEEDACAGNDTCFDGRTGFACSQCESGWYRSGSGCSQCSPGQGEALIVFFFFFMLLFVILIVRMSLTSAIDDSKYGASGIALNFLQVTALFASLDSDWPSYLLDLFTSLSALNFNINMSAPECALGYLSFASKLYITLFIPIIIPVFIALATGVVWLYYKLRAALSRTFADSWAACGLSNASFLTSALRALLIMLSLAYMPMTYTTLKVFNCIPLDDGSLVLNAAPSITCFSSEWNSLLPVGIIALLVYVGGIPLLFALILVKNQNRLDQPVVMTRFGYIYRRFKVFWWEVFIMLRKLFVTLILVLGTAYLPVQSVLTVFVLLIALLTNMLVKPYQSSWLNHMESFCLVTNLFTALAVGVFRSEFNVRNNIQSSTGVILMLIIVVNLIIVFLAIFYEIYLICTVVTRYIHKAIIHPAADGKQHDSGNSSPTHRRNSSPDDVVFHNELFDSSAAGPSSASSPRIQFEEIPPSFEESQEQQRSTLADTSSNPGEWKKEVLGTVRKSGRALAGILTGGVIGDDDSSSSSSSGGGGPRQRSTAMEMQARFGQ